MSYIYACRDMYAPYVYLYNVAIILLTLTHEVLSLRVIDTQQIFPFMILIHEGVTHHVIDP
jgi:hypothetical protein